MRVAVYMRCGNNDQAAEDAIQMQETALCHFAQDKGYEIAAKYHDIDIGWNMERKGLKSLLEDAASGKFEKVIATKYSRLAIGTALLMELTEQLNAVGVYAEAIHEPPLTIGELPCLYKALCESKL